MTDRTAGPVFLEVAPRLAGDFHLFDRNAELSAETLERFRADGDANAAAEAELRERGLTPVAANGFSITVRADGDRARHLKEMPEAEAEKRLLEDGGNGGSTIAGLAKTPEIHTNIPPVPPPAGYFHLRAPTDLLTGLNAKYAPANGWTGTGVRIAVVDSGCYVQHPYFLQLGVHIHVALAAGATDPDQDGLGHGTLVCGNVAAIAPRAEITMVKTPDDASLAGFKQAVAMDPRPDIIQNTWGNETSETTTSPYERAVQAAVLDAIGRGCLVIFAGGNGKILFPPQIPEAIGVGGVYMSQEGRFFAASYASGYASAIFDNRIVPDFCGLVGMEPNGVYLALPTSPGSIIDEAFAAQPFPMGDGGLGDDGWVVVSGTSSASAQTSGVLALLKQISPDLDQAAAKRVLASTAVRINLGASAQGSPTGPPWPNLATGHGLIDIDAAVKSLL